MQSSRRSFVLAPVACLLFRPARGLRASGPRDAPGQTVSGAEAFIAGGTAPSLGDPGAKEAARSLAPTGRLRVAINLGNSVLAQRTPAGELTGVSVILAKLLAQRVSLPLDLTAYNAAGAVFDALAHNAWDLAFLAIEPERAAKIEFSPAYVFIEGTYLVRKEASFQKAGDLDGEGVRVAVARGAAYDLYLSRTLKKAELVRAPTSAAAMQMFLDDHLEAAAGVRQALAAFAQGKPELRVLRDSFSRIDQAMATPKGRPVASAYVRAFIEEMKASGQVRRALDEAGQKDAEVAPPEAMHEAR